MMPESDIAVEDYGKYEATSPWNQILRNRMD